MGASWVRKNILEKYPTADLSVYAVWVPYLGGSRSDVDPRVFSDKRVKTYWDDGDIVSTAIAGDLDPYSSIGFDVYAVYGPDAAWGGRPVDWGRPVITDSDRLGRRVEELIGA